MNKAVVLATVRSEIEEAKQYGEAYNWIFSEIDEDKQSFTVLLQSPIGTPVGSETQIREKFLVEFVFDGYPAQPYLINFIDPAANDRGKRTCIPHCDDSFFNQGRLVICHQCNRGAYVQGLHPDWDLSAWRSLAGGLTDLKWILEVIFSRISDPTKYHGRFK